MPSVVAGENCVSDGSISQDIEEFSSQTSPESLSISDFSDESQSILRGINQNGFRIFFYSMGPVGLR